MHSILAGSTRSTFPDPRKRSANITHSDGRRYISHQRKLGQKTAESDTLRHKRKAGPDPTHPKRRYYNITFEPGGQNITVQAIKNIRTGNDIVEIVRSNFHFKDFLIYRNTNIVHKRDALRDGDSFTVVRAQKPVIKRRKYWYR